MINICSDGGGGDGGGDATSSLAPLLLILRTLATFAAFVLSGVDVRPPPPTLPVAPPASGPCGAPQLASSAGAAPRL
jgi:hypothetical protein